MKNISLLIFDIICFPITLVRLFLIYFYGSCYNVPSLQFLDVMLHANRKYFNQGQEITIDTTSTDVRQSINRASRVDAELLNEHIKTSLNNNKLAMKPDIEMKPDIDMKRGSIFGNKSETNLKNITLRVDKNVSANDIRTLQNLLPNILKQISLTNEINNNDIEIDIAKIDEEFKKELDFLSFDEKNDSDSDLEIESKMEIDNISDM